jgi:hypothetical protein
MLIGDQRWRANYLRTPQTGGFSLLHPPPAIGSKLAGGDLVYNGRKDPDDALRERAILSFKVYASVPYARCRYSKHFRWRGRRTKLPDLLRKWLWRGEVCDLRSFSGSADHAKHKSVFVIFHRTRALNCNVTHLSPPWYRHLV